MVNPERAPTTADALETALVTMLEDASLDDAPMPMDVEWVGSFGEAGIPTSDAGLVVVFANGATYQVTIVQSQQAKD